MSKYGQLSRNDGHAKWFLMRTLAEHDPSMDDPWMKMIYKQCFTVEQYAAWLCRNRACFAALEARVTEDTCPEVFDASLHRTAALDTDLRQLLGDGWAAASELAQDSAATRQYLAHLAEDASSPKLLAAHHFLQYNAVLSGGAYLGKMVAEKLCLLPGAPGVAFYAFSGVAAGKEPARVQQYLRDFNKLSLSDQEREEMLVAMRRVYLDTEAMMQECFELNPMDGVSYAAAKDKAASAAALPPAPCGEQLELSLQELHSFVGEGGGRILLSIAGDLLDVSAGAELYGPGGSYALLAGHDVTRCLATMSLEASDLDDLAWRPEGDEESQSLTQWWTKLREKYPVAGRLREYVGDAGLGAAAAAAPASQVDAAEAGAAAAAAADAGAANDGQKCPISGKEGAGCPMAAFGIVKKPAAKAKASSKSSGGSGFAAGKSLIASVEASSGGTDDWWLAQLCPLHWDFQTMKAFLAVGASAWLNGVFIGWMLHKRLRNRSR